MFIGRERELATLNKLYASDQFEFVVIYGRRRVGKTALISQFIDDKNAIYFMGVESNAKQNLENFSKSIMSYHTGMDAETSFLSFQAALEYVFKLSEKERIILAIDEYPYVARSSKSLASTIQLLIDQYKNTSKLMLILCGSSMSYMEDHVLAYKAPLYGRRTAQMKILPFDFDETCHYFKNFTDEEKAYVYGIVGGTPQYLLQMSDKLSIEDNIKNTFLNPNSALFEEPENLLKQEVREPALYNAIITAIATGASRMSEISGKVGESTNICSAYVKNLISLGIIEKETPYGERRPEKRFIRLRIICSAFGIVLCRKTIRSSPVALPTWHTNVSSRICPIIWARYLRKSASNISGSCCSPANVRWSFPPSAAGGATTLKKSVRRKSISSPNRIKTQPFSGSVNGRMRKSISAFWKRL